MNVAGQPPQPALEESLPSLWYLEERVFDIECRHLFAREWVCIGREEDLDARQGRMVIERFGQSIIVTRNQAGALRAFYNVCRHRGSELCASKEREARPGRVDLKGGFVGHNMIRCAYHSWAYNLDGELVAAPHLADGVTINKKDFSLYPVGIETWNGFLFIHLEPATAQPLAQALGDVAGRIRRYPLADLRVGARIHYDVEANWKVLAENYNECYHCAGVHPELVSLVPAFGRNGGAGLDWENGVEHRAGAYTFTTTGTTTRKPFPGLNDSERDHHKGELVYPNLFISLASDHAACFVLTPRGAGRTEIDCLFLFAQDEIARTDFDPSDAVDFWHLVNMQDWTVCERVQRGMANRVHRSGYYAPMEDWNLDIRRYVTSRIGAHL